MHEQHKDNNNRHLDRGKDPGGLNSIIRTIDNEEVLRVTKIVFFRTEQTKGCEIYFSSRFKAQTLLAGKSERQGPGAAVHIKFTNFPTSFRGNSDAETSGRWLLCPCGCRLGTQWSQEAVCIHPCESSVVV